MTEGNEQNDIRKYALLILGAVGFLFSSGKWNVPVMAWIWPVCMLYFQRKTKVFWKKRIPVALMILLSIPKWYGMAAGSQLEQFYIPALLTWLYSVPFILDSYFYKKVGGYKACFLLPLGYATVEFVMSLLFFSTLDSFAVTQFGNEPLMQLASVLGTYGISFLVVWFSTTVMFVIEKYEETKKILKEPIAVYLTVLFIVLSFGGFRLAFIDTTVSTVKIAVTTGNNVGVYTSDPPQRPIDDCIASMLKDVQTAAGGGAELIHFCEEAFIVSADNKDKMISATEQAAIKNHIDILMALGVENPKGLNENKLYYIDHEGNEVFEYEKSHLVPGVETGEYLQGDGHIPNYKVTLQSGREIKLATVICMDSNFVGFIREGTESDTQILLVSTWDWKAIDDYHNKWVLYRSLENGFSTIRSTDDGYTTAIDPYGRELMIYSTDHSGRANVSFVNIPMERFVTPYKAIGFIIDWFYPVGLLLLIGIGVTFNKRQRS